mmetsp:Transcript_18099/g.27147  ORF Transcript_18099/g.27147 Transcript_18099/m.27147 type:complete len:424 (-) Transcript_18099:17-1288(-)
MINGKESNSVKEIDAKDFSSQLLISHLIRNEPLIIRNMVSDWAAVSKWNISYLKDKFGSKYVSAAPLVRAKKWKNAWVEASKLWDVEWKENVKKRTSTAKATGHSKEEEETKKENVRREGSSSETSISASCPNNERPLTLVFLNKRKKITLNEFFENLPETTTPTSRECKNPPDCGHSVQLSKSTNQKSHGGYYVDGGSNMEKDGTRENVDFLSSDLGKLSVTDSILHPKRKSLWLGGYAMTSMHFDSVENLFAVVSGTKRLNLVSPRHSKHINCVMMNRGVADCDIVSGKISRLGILSAPVHNYASFNFVDSTLSSLKKKGVTVLSCDVRSGDVIFLPAHWWHRVESIPGENRLCAAVSHFYKPMWGYMNLTKKHIDPLKNIKLEKIRKAFERKGRIPSSIKIIMPEYESLWAEQSAKFSAK